MIKKQKPKFDEKKITVALYIFFFKDFHIIFMQNRNFV